MRNALRCVVILLVCLTLFVSAEPADAQIGPSKGQVAGIFAIIIGVGAAIGIGTYYLIRRPHSITGCVAAGADGLQLRDEGDQQIYLLVGDVADVKSGERVRVKGRKKKSKIPVKQRSFLVEKFSKDFGACKVQPSAP